METKINRYKEELSVKKRKYPEAGERTKDEERRRV